MRILQIHSTPAIASASAPASLRKATQQPAPYGDCKEKHKGSQRECKSPWVGLDFCCSEGQRESGIGKILLLVLITYLVIRHGTSFLLQVRGGSDFGWVGVKCG